MPMFSNIISLIILNYPKYSKLTKENPPFRFFIVFPIFTHNFSRFSGCKLSHASRPSSKSHLHSLHHTVVPSSWSPNLSSNHHLSIHLALTEGADSSYKCFSLHSVQTHSSLHRIYWKVLTFSDSQTSIFACHNCYGSTECHWSNNFVYHEYILVMVIQKSPCQGITEQHFTSSTEFSPITRIYKNCTTWVSL